MKSLTQYINESKTHSNQDIFKAKKYLEAHLKDFELDGCEISDEDAVDMLNLVKKGKTQEEAMEEILSGIRDVLD